MIKKLLHRLFDSEDRLFEKNNLSGWVPVGIKNGLRPHGKSFFRLKPEWEVSPGTKKGPLLPEAFFV